MIYPSARLTAQLQRVTADKMYPDSAYLLMDVATGAYDEYNQPIIITIEIPLNCSFTDNPAQEQWIGYADIEVLAAEVRFKSPQPTKGNRVRLIGRFGETTSPNDEYEIIGIRERGTFGYVCALKKVSV
jgi:hypothetical protein